MLWIPHPSWVKSLPVGPALLVAGVVTACAVYANLAYFVTAPGDYRYFPPFKPGYNANFNRELGGETYEIAKALLAGEGFAHPFKEQTGPAAWTAPVHPLYVP